MFFSFLRSPFESNTNNKFSKMLMVGMKCLKGIIKMKRETFTQDDEVRISTMPKETITPLVMVMELQMLTKIGILTCTLPPKSPSKALLTAID